MRYPYLKLFSEVRTDAKLASLTDAQHRTWLNLLCFASEQPERGKITGLTAHRIAVEVCRGNVELLLETCNALGALQSVTSRYIALHGAQQAMEITFLAFEKRQWGKPSDNPEKVKARVARHRSKKRYANPNGHVTPCNALVTPSNALVTRCNALEGEGDREEENTPLPLKGGSPQRDPADADAIRQAERLLASDPRTEHLALELGRQHNSTGLIDVAGWKWLRAAERIRSPSCSDGQRKRFAYFAGIAKNLTDDEREEKPNRETKAEESNRVMAEMIAERIKRREAREAELAEG